jgi:Plasmid pRiA4b ORF-3-like protein
MIQSSAQPSVYQLRVVLRGISPLIWRRLLVRSDTTLAHLHDMLQIVFAWSGEHLHSFHIHGKEYGSGGADTRHVALTDFRLHRGERFHYVYDYTADWICDIRLEAVLPLAPRRICPVCIGGKRAAPPEECRGAWAYLERLEQRRTHPPIEAMLVVADAISTLLEANPHTTVREALGDLDELREAVERLETYERLQPEHFDRRHINTRLQSQVRHGGEAP